MIRILLFDVEPPRAYTLVFEGQGGVAGFAKGQASVKLTPEDGATRLGYSVKAMIGGKLAQVEGPEYRPGREYRKQYVELKGAAEPRHLHGLVAGG